MEGRIANTSPLQPIRATIWYTCVAFAHRCTVVIVPIDDGTCGIEQHNAISPSVVEYRALERDHQYRVGGYDRSCIDDMGRSRRGIIDLPRGNVDSYRIRIKKLNPFGIGTGVGHIFVDINDRTGLRLKMHAWQHKHAYNEARYDDLA